MILSKIKTWALAALGILSAVLFGLLGLNKAKHAKAKQKGVEKARKVERDATDKLTEGLKKEQEGVKNAKSRTGKRDHFT